MSRVAELLSVSKLDSLPCTKCGGGLGWGRFDGAAPAPSPSLPRALRAQRRGQSGVDAYAPEEDGEISAPLPVWALALLMHVACSAAALVLAARFPSFLPGGTWCWLEGGSAAILGVAAGLPVWWLPINLLFVPALYALLEWQISPSVYFTAFCIIAVFNVAAWRHRVPLFLTSAAVTRALVGVLPKRAGLRFMDLGCGTGSLLIDVAQALPGAGCEGIETAPLPYLVSRWRLRAHTAVRVAWGDFWGADFSRFDVVYAYLSPQPMTRLWQKARSEMRPGSLLISNTFAVPGVEPTYTIPVADCMRSVLYVWRMEGHCS